MNTQDLQVAPPPPSNLRPRVMVVGVGGAGGNAIANMQARQVEGVEYLYANTDAQALDNADVANRLQLGVTLTRGLGAGANPEVGAEAARESTEDLRSLFEGVNMVFIAAGMGGGTGTGSAPVIAQLAREMGILSVGVVSRPFSYEGKVRRRLADDGINRMREHVDSLIVVPNQNLFRVTDRETTFMEAFRMVDDILCDAVRSVTDLMMVPGLINLDFNDINTVLQNRGDAMIGMGECDGENRGKNAAEKAITNPLLENGISLKTASAMLINITGGDDLTLYDVDEALQRITAESGEDTNIIHGATPNAGLSGTVRVSIIATGVKFIQSPPLTEGSVPRHGGGSSDSALRSTESRASLAPAPAPAASPDGGSLGSLRWRDSEERHRTGSRSSSSAAAVSPAVNPPLRGSSWKADRATATDLSSERPVFQQTSLGDSSSLSSTSDQAMPTPAVDDHPFIPRPAAPVVGDSVSSSSVLGGEAAPLNRVAEAPRVAAPRVEASRVEASRVEAPRAMLPSDLSSSSSVAMVEEHRPLNSAEPESPVSRRPALWERLLGREAAAETAQAAVTANAAHADAAGAGADSGLPTSEKVVTGGASSASSSQKMATSSGLAVSTGSAALDVAPAADSHVAAGAADRNALPLEVLTSDAGAPDPDDPLQEDSETLKIPAFLRRQAN